MTKLRWAEDEHGVTDYPVFESRARKLWVPYNGFRFPPPRLIQLLNIVICFVSDHRWSQWRMETEDWFEYVEAPEPYAWRACRRCHLLQHVRPSLTKESALG